MFVAAMVVKNSWKEILMALTTLCVLIIIAIDASGYSTLHTDANPSWRGSIIFVTVLSSIAASYILFTGKDKLNNMAEFALALGAFAALIAILSIDATGYPTLHPDTNKSWQGAIIFATFIAGVVALISFKELGEKLFEEYGNARTGMATQFLSLASSTTKLPIPLSGPPPLPPAGPPPETYGKLPAWPQQSSVEFPAELRKNE